LFCFNQLAKLFDLLRCFDCGSTFKLQKTCFRGSMLLATFICLSLSIQILFSNIRTLLRKKTLEFFFIMNKNESTTVLLWSVSPVKVKSRLKWLVTLVTYCYNNVLVYFNLKLNLTTLVKPALST
jgi:hypothetical protein